MLTRNTHAPRARSQSVIVGMVSCGRKTKVRRSVQRAKFSYSMLCKVAEDSFEVEDG